MEWWLGYLALGAVVGVLAGMLGIGGGAIIVPLLVMLFDAQGMPKNIILHLAVGTGMATILFTSVSSVRAHSARGSLRFDIVWKISPGILFGGLLGAAIAGKFSTNSFALFFTAFVFFAATSMLLDKRPKPTRQLPGAIGMFVGGSVIGTISSLAAVGGAVMTIPYLLYCNVPMLQAIGTAAAVGFPIALSGSIGYALFGFSESGLPPYSFGYIYLPAMAGVAIASVLTAPLGAAAAHHLPTRRLKQIFAVLLYVLAIRMLITLW